MIDPTHHLLSRQEAAELLGLKEATLASWKARGRYDLPVIKVGRLVRYRHSDLLAFLERRTERPGIQHKQESQS